MILPLRVPWSEEEVALLIDIYQKVKIGELNRKEAIDNLSDILRNFAKKNGNQINDVYRNKTGISMRFLEIQRLFEKTLGGLTHTSSLFVRMVDMYNRNRQAFDEILKKSKNIFGIKKNDSVGLSKKEMSNFEEYLNKSKHFKLNGLINEILSDLKTIGEYFEKTKLIKIALLDIEDKETLLKINSIVENSNLFKLLNKNKYCELRSSWQLFYRFKKDVICSESETESDATVDNISYELVNNLTEKRLFEKYTTIYERIFNLLKDEIYSNKWFAVVDIYNSLDRVAKIADIEHILDNVSWVTCDENKYKFVTSNSFGTQDKVIYINEPIKPLIVEEPTGIYKTNRNECIVDFNNMKEYQYTKPISCSCFGDDLLFGNKWAKLYVAVISKIYFKYPDYFIPGMSFSDKNGSRMDFCNKFRVHEMVRPVEIDNTFLYLESNLSARDIIRKIKYVLDLCNIDYKEVVIKYSVAESISPNETPTSSIPPTLPINKPKPNQNPNYVKVLKEMFPNGFKLTSRIDLRKFKTYYQELIGVNIDNIDEDKIKKEIRICGIEYDEKIYIPENLLTSEAKAKLLTYIEKSFKDGKTEIYYEALFNEFNDVFLDNNILDSSMLKSYLDFINDGNYFIKRNFISKDRFAELNPYNEIKQFLIENPEPLSTSEICKKLPNLPADLIKNTLAINSEFVRNAKSVYFHADVLDLNNEELEKIANYIEITINSQNYITGNELYDAIKIKLPSVFADKSLFSPLGWREALKYKLNGRFDFKGNVISRYGETIKTSDIFSNYASSRSEFSIDDVVILSEELEVQLTSYYFDAVYKYALRVSQNKFVNKNQVSFDIEATDKAISRFCSGKYIPIKEINEFGSFPDATFPWTDYMLEQYVDQYSEKFILIHSGYNRNSIAGAIVKKEANIASIDDLVVDILSNEEILLKKDVILEYLVQMGYIVTRAYKNLDELIQKANSIRNMKRKNK